VLTGTEGSAVKSCSWGNEKRGRGEGDERMIIDQARLNKNRESRCFSQMIMLEMSVTCSTSLPGALKPAVAFWKNDAI
jgi:hypothetical protein